MFTQLHMYLHNSFNSFSKKKKKKIKGRVYASIFIEAYLYISVHGYLYAYVL